MSTATIATILLLGVFLVLVFLRVPVVYAIGVASLLDFFYLGINPMQMALKFVSNLNSYTLLAVPFFILMGELMSAGISMFWGNSSAPSVLPNTVFPTFVPAFYQYLVESMLRCKINVTFYVVVELSGVDEYTDYCHVIISHAGLYQLQMSVV